jgi:hypothetical protein
VAGIEQLKQIVASFRKRPPLQVVGHDAEHGVITLWLNHGDIPGQATLYKYFDATGYEVLGYGCCIERGHYLRLKQ